MLEAHGCLLRATTFGDSDVIATLWTDEFGKLSVVARGGKRSQKRFGSALGPLTWACWQVARPTRGELWSTQSAVVLDDWTPLAANVVAFAHASYAIEVVRDLLPAEQAAPEVSPILRATWDALVTPGPSAAGLRWFELAILDVAGVAPRLDSCVKCGTPRAATPATGTTWWFDGAAGGVVCPSCAAGWRGGALRAFDAQVGAYLVAVGQQASPAIAARLDPGSPREVRHEARAAMVAMIQQALGQRPRSLDFLEDLARDAPRDGRSIKP